MKFLFLLLTILFFFLLLFVGHLSLASPRSGSLSLLSGSSSYRLVRRFGL